MNVLTPDPVLGKFTCPPGYLLRIALKLAGPNPAHFEEHAARTSAMVHEFPGRTDELRSLQAPTLLIFGDRDFSPLPDVAETLGLLPNAQLAVPKGDHTRRRHPSDTTKCSR